MKKILVPVLAAVMLFALCGCSMKEVAPAGDSDVRTYKIGVAIYTYDTNFMVLYRNEIESYFKTLETDKVKYEITAVDSKNDMAEQTNQINAFIAQGMDAVILNLVQTSSADVVIDKLVEAHIPVILVNREPQSGDGEENYPGIVNNPNVCYIGADARQSGIYQGEMIAALENRGDLNGDGKTSYIMLEGDPENIDAQYRTRYSVEALTDAGVEVECLYDQVGNWDQTKGQELCANALSEFGDRIEVVFCNNDAMALGAKAAIDVAGRKVGEDIYLVGVDGLVEACEMILSGGMTGTVFNDYFTQAHTAVDVTVKALQGGEIGNYYWVPYVRINAENAQRFIDLQK